MDYQLPDDIGTFEVRVYAIDSTAHFGVATAEQVTRRPLSLQSAAPRIVRQGDEFLTGVTVTIHEPEFDGEITISVSHVCQLLELHSLRSKTLHLKGPGPHLVNFHFVAIGAGNAYLAYTAAIAGETVDKALYSQSALGYLCIISYVLSPISSQQEPVYVATSFAVSESSPSSQGFVLPDAVPYSGKLNVDVGMLPYSPNPFVIRFRSWSPRCYNCSKRYDLSISIVSAS